MWFDFNRHTKKAIVRIQHLNRVKTLSKVGMEGSFLNFKKAIIHRSTVEIIFNEKDVYESPLRSGISKGVYYHQHCLS